MNPEYEAIAIDAQTADREIVGVVVGAMTGAPADGEMLSERPPNTGHDSGGTQGRNCVVSWGEQMTETDEIVVADAGGAAGTTHTGESLEA